MDNATRFLYMFNGRKTVSDCDKDEPLYPAVRKDTWPEFLAAAKIILLLENSGGVIFQCWEYSQGVLINSNTEGEGYPSVYVETQIALDHTAAPYPIEIRMVGKCASTRDGVLGMLEAEISRRESYRKWNPTEISEIKTSLEWAPDSI